ncbi:ATP-dependent helicase [Opitutaceae bacterium TAV4]|nr:ATP-dependent helicase [Opitutaceae bacterium TAV4]RRK01131.1 ATP-dependent helicase [Opitutaceae bacterium TAV3]
MDYYLDNQPPADSAATTAATIDFAYELNEEQLAAVTAPPGPLLVLAGAGSGKTRTLTYRVAWLLGQGIKPWQILLLTFTNKAAKEMLHRVQDLTGVEPGRFWGGTFHSIGSRILRMHGDAIGVSKNFTILDADDSETILKQAVESADRLFFKNKTNPKPSPLHSVLSLARNTCQTIAATVEKYFPQYQDISQKFPSFADAYQKRKREQNLLDYDDLLELWLELLKKAPDVAAYFSHRFEHLLVDEYQDTNTLQSQIIDLMGAHHRIMAVGDDAQCIYSWRGADFENIMTFETRHPGTVIHRIETNYRSTPQILALANGVLEAQPRGRHFEKELRAHRSNSQKPFLVQAMDAREQAEFIIKRISGLVDEGCALSDIAILYRAHFQALEIQVELSKRGIPYLITSGVKFFERQHIRDLVALLQFVYNPGNETAWARIACLLPKIGEKGAAKIHAAAREHARLLNLDLIDALSSDDVKSKVSKDAREGSDGGEWAHFCASLREVAAAMHSDPKPAKAVELAIDGWYGDYLKGAFADYTERLDELKALITFAQRHEDIHEMLAQITLLNGETSDRKVEPDADAIRLTTVHQAKGLEYAAVFLINLADGLFPLRRSIENGDEEEERRLFYVAVTRARDELYLCVPKIGSRPGPNGMMLTPSRFLAELRPHLYEPLRIKRHYGW